MIAFLFDKQQTTPMIEPAFFEALTTASEAKLLRSRLFKGSLLLRTLAQSMVAASRTESTTKTMMQSDAATFRTLAGDLGECLSARAHTVDTARLLELFLTHDIECLALGTCALEFAERIEAALQAEQSYVRYVVPDLGNPIHYKLFVELLSNRTQIAALELIEAWPDAMSLPQDFRPFVRRAVLNEDFEEIADPLPARKPVSVDGMRSQRRYQAAQARRPYRLREQVARVALESVELFRLDGPPSGARKKRASSHEIFRLEVDPQDLRRKLTEYALNEHHKTGKHKARVFAAKLGLTDAEWLSLAAQIAENVADAEIYRVVHSKHGLHFRTRMDVVGLDVRPLRSRLAGSFATVSSRR